MKTNKLQTLFSIIVILLSTLFISCEKEEDNEGIKNTPITTITSKRAGTLKNLISEEDKHKIEGLEVIGDINLDDMKYIQEMAYISVLNLEKATYTPGTTLDKGTVGKLPNLISFKIPSNIIYISELKLENLRQFHIPALVESISDISECSSLTKFTVDSENKKYTAIDGVLCDFDKRTLISYPNMKATEYQIPKTITSITSNAFSNCTNLKTIAIPSNVQNIESSDYYDYDQFSSCKNLKTVFTAGSVKLKITDPKITIRLMEEAKTICDSAFMGCSGINEFTITRGIESIGKMAFAGCDAIRFNVQDGNKNYTAVDDVLFSTDKKKIISYPMGKNSSAYIIPSTVEIVCFGSFYGNPLMNLKITIPQNVKSIEPYALVSIWNHLHRLYIQFESTTPPQIDSNGLDRSNKYFVPKGSRATYVTTYPQYFTTYNTVEE